MTFNRERATWIDTAGVCTEAGTPNCKGKLGVDFNNRTEVNCSSFNCSAQLSAAALATTVAVSQVGSVE